MRLPAVITGALGAALLLASPQREAFAHESQWLRWRPKGGVVQHILINDGAASNTMTVAPLFSGSCDESQRSMHLKADPRFSSTVYRRIAAGCVVCPLDADRRAQYRLHGRSNGCRRQ
jgi:hypothetical protein